MNNIVIIGLGKTGLSCAAYFASHCIPFAIMDTRENPPGLREFQAKYPKAAIYLGGLKFQILSHAKTVVVSPGLAQDHPVLQSLRRAQPNIEIIGDIELFARAYQGSVVAITGSNGKSTVTTLVGEMVKMAYPDPHAVGVGGNLGTPALSLLQGDVVEISETQHPAISVLELSSFQLETTDSLKPHVAALLNISADHMDRYDSLQTYEQAKARIFRKAESVVLNRDDRRVMYYAPKTIPRLTFGLNAPMNENDYGVIKTNLGAFLSKGQRKLLAITDLKIIGLHNIANALAALAIAEFMNLPVESSLNDLRKFQGLPHRSEWIRNYKDLSFINDSKGTNVGATLATLLGLEGSISGQWILIAGGVTKNADFSELTTQIAKQCRAVVLMGEAARHLFDLWSPAVSCYRVSSMEEAVEKSVSLAKPGDGVLLSPACASTDMFKNFEERGEIFREIVKAL